MRKVKRMVALVLALMLIFTLMAMTASAAAAKAGYSCSSCGSTNTVVSSYNVAVKSTHIASCPRVVGSHYHITMQPMRKITCGDCKYVYSFNNGSTYVTCNGVIIG